MSKKYKNLKARSKSVTKKQSNTHDIHTAFKQHVQKLKIYPTLVYQHGERLFIRSDDGGYNSLVIRALFEVYEKWVTE